MMKNVIYQELSDEQLETVTGGFLNNNQTNVNINSQTAFGGIAGNNSLNFFTANTATGGSNFNATSQINAKFSDVF